jgi:hypothetical protein
MAVCPLLLRACSAGINLKGAEGCEIMMDDAIETRSLAETLILERFPYQLAADGTLR